MNDVLDVLDPLEALDPCKGPDPVDSAEQSILNRAEESVLADDRYFATEAVPPYQPQDQLGGTVSLSPSLLNEPSFTLPPSRAELGFLTYQGPNPARFLDSGFVRHGGLPRSRSLSSLLRPRNLGRPWLARLGVANSDPGPSDDEEELKIEVRSSWPNLPPLEDEEDEKEGGDDGNAALEESFEAMEASLTRLRELQEARDDGHEQE